MQKSVFDTVNDICSDAAPVIIEERVDDRLDQCWHGLNKIRDCTDQAFDERHDDLRAGHDDLRKIVKNPLYNPDNKLWHSRSKLRNGFNQAVDERHDKLYTGFYDFGEVFSKRGDEICDNLGSHLKQPRDGVNDSVRQSEDDLKRRIYQIPEIARVGQRFSDFDDCFRCRRDQFRKRLRNALYQRDNNIYTGLNDFRQKLDYGRNENPNGCRRDVAKHRKDLRERGHKSGN